MSNWLPLASTLTGVILVPSALLAIAPGIKERSWRRWGLATATAAAGIAAPLLAFFAAIVFTPEWKGGCRCGWLDCFHTGKLALLPLVFWALKPLEFAARAVVRSASGKHITNTGGATR